MATIHEAYGAKFGKLSPNDRAALLAPIKKAARERLQAALQAGGVTGEAYVNELDAFDQTSWGDAEFFNYCIRDVEGRAATIARACIKANGAEAAVGILDNLDVNPGDDLDLAAQLAGIKLVKNAIKDATPGDDPRPSEPASSSP